MQPKEGKRRQPSCTGLCLYGRDARTYIEASQYLRVLGGTTEVVPFHKTIHETSTNSPSPLGLSVQPVHAVLSGQQAVWVASGLPPPLIPCESRSFRARC